MNCSQAQLGGDVDVAAVAAGQLARHVQAKPCPAMRWCRPTYGALVEAVRQSPVVIGDETGGHVNGDLAWL